MHCNLQEATLGDGAISILPAGVIEIPIIDLDSKNRLSQHDHLVSDSGGAELASERLRQWLSRVYEKTSNFVTSNSTNHN